MLNKEYRISKYFFTSTFCVRYSLFDILFLDVPGRDESRPYRHRPRTRTRYYHFISTLPHVRPPPNTGMQIISPFLMLPSLTASSRALAQDAEDELPYLSMVT